MLQPRVRPPVRIPDPEAGAFLGLRNSLPAALPGALQKAGATSRSVVLVCGHALCALLLVILGGRDGLQLGLPILSWQWDDPRSPASGRTQSGLVNSLSPHRICFELPLAPPVPLVGLLIAASLALPGGVTGRASQRLRRCAAVLLVFSLGGLVELPVIILACAAACVDSDQRWIELALWTPPLSALCVGATMGGSWPPFFAAVSFAALSSAARVFPSAALAFLTDSFYVLVLCVFETFPGLRWVSPHCGLGGPLL